MMQGKILNRKHLMKQLSKGKTAQKTTEKTREEWMDRWAGLSGVEPDDYGPFDYSKIDWENKYIRLEYLLCDIKLQKKLGDEDTRAEAIMNDIPDDLKDIFYSIGPGNSKPYSEVYLTKSIIKDTLRDMRNRAIDNKKGKQ